MSDRRIDAAAFDVDRMTLETWERRTDWPLTGLAVLFLVCYAWPILDLT